MPLLAIAATAAALSLAPATPPEAVGLIAPRAHVSYADLDIVSPAGRQAMQERLSAAARDVCGANAPGAAMNLSPSVFRDCYAYAMRNAAVSADRAVAARSGAAALALAERTDRK